MVNANEKRKYVKNEKPYLDLGPLCTSHLRASCEKKKIQSLCLIVDYFGRRVGEKNDIFVYCILCLWLVMARWSQQRSLF